jgi:hypothetical protein
VARFQTSSDYEKTTGHNAEPKLLNATATRNYTKARRTDGIAAFQKSGPKFEGRFRDS